MTFGPGVKPQRSKILRVSQKKHIWEVLSGAPLALLIVILIIVTIIFIEGLLSVPGTVLGAAHISVILTTTLWGGYYYLQLYKRGN